jgi:hypothetical protein
LYKLTRTVVVLASRTENGSFECPSFLLPSALALVVVVANKQSENTCSESKQ